MPTLHPGLQATALPRHFVPEEEWEKMRLTVPGFRELEAEDNAAHRSRKEKKRPMSRAYTLYKKIDSITESPKLGRSDTMSSLPQLSIKLKNGLGEIVLMPASKAAYIYHAPDKSPVTTQAIAQTLMVAAGWHSPESAAKATIDQGPMQSHNFGLRVRAMPVNPPVSIASKKSFSYSLDQVRAHLIAERKDVLKAYQAYKAVHGEEALRDNPYLSSLREQTTTLRTIEMLQEKGVHWAGYNVPGQGSKQFSDNVAFLAALVQDRPELIPTGNSTDALKQINSIIATKRQMDARRHKEQTAHVAQKTVIEEERAKAASAVLKGMTIIQTMPPALPAQEQPTQVATINTAKIVAGAATEKALTVGAPPPAPLQQAIQTRRPRFGALMSWTCEAMQKIKNSVRDRKANLLTVLGASVFTTIAVPSQVDKVLLLTTLVSGVLALKTGEYLYNMYQEDKKTKPPAKQPKVSRPRGRSIGMSLAT